MREPNIETLKKLANIFNVSILHLSKTVLTAVKYIDIMRRL